MPGTEEEAWKKPAVWFQVVPQERAGYGILFTPGLYPNPIDVKVQKIV